MKKRRERIKFILCGGNRVRKIKNIIYLIPAIILIIVNYYIYFLDGQNTIIAGIIAGITVTGLILFGILHFIKFILNETKS